MRGSILGIWLVAVAACSSDNAGAPTPDAHPGADSVVVPSSIDAAPAADVLTLPDAAPAIDAPPATPDAAPVGTGCTVTLSGSVTDTFPCTVQAVYTTLSSSGGVNFNASPLPSDLNSWSAAGAWPGMPMMQTYMTSDFTGFAFVIMTKTLGFYGADKGGTAPQEGTLTVTFTSVTMTGTSDTGDIYEVHGTADSTMPGELGTTGTVTAHVAF